jgi:hypothetical protein
MNATYACPACETAVRQQFDADSTTLACPHCGQQVRITAGSIDGERVKRCLACPSSDLYVRKDFPQRIGVLIVAVGIVGSSIAWHYGDLAWTFGILFATALADVALVAVVGNALMCYRCGAQYRGVEKMDAHGPFRLETHEKHRQLAARVGSTAAGRS